MQNVKNFILQNNLINPGERIGVGVSGGSDSMALVHFLHSLSEELDIEVIAIHIDHGIREESRDEANFVIDKCREMGVRAYKFRIDSPKIAKEKNISLETAAREGRYGVFNSLFKKDVVDKIALAHHLSDQAETILMHIFRGSGVAGARGMEPIRDGRYIRPLLTTSKEEILDYINFNNLDYVSDSSNADNTFTRNYLRNVLVPQITKKWPGAISAIVNFGKAVKEDDDYINSQIFDDAIIYEDKEAKIPLSYFIYPSSIISRMIIKALKNIGVKVDFEKKHIDAIKDLASGHDNGKRISLPFDVVAIKDMLPKEGVVYFDYRKVPKSAMWRFRQDGDVFTKFGGGSKKLKSFLIDKKIPQRKRDTLPVLADENQVFVIAGVEISELVKVDGVPTAYSVEIKE